MTRVSLSKAEDVNKNYSVGNPPGGFWSPPGGRRSKYYMDVGENEVHHMKSGKITTRNKFKPLEDHKYVNNVLQDRSEDNHHNKT